jgi:hypothetical protein
MTDETPQPEMGADIHTVRVGWGAAAMAHFDSQPTISGVTAKKVGAHANLYSLTGSLKDLLELAELLWTQGDPRSGFDYSAQERGWAKSGARAIYRQLPVEMPWFMVPKRRRSPRYRRRRR